MKWKNYGLWVSLASILYMVFKDLGLQIDLTTWETYVTAIIGLLAALGIISNPDKGKGFFDKIPNSPAEAITQVAEQLQYQDESSNGQQEMPPQNQNPGKVQQFQEYPPQQNQSQPDQNIQQNNLNTTNSEHNKYQDYTNGMQNNLNHNGPPFSQEVEPTQIQPGINVQVDQYTETPSRKQTPSNTSFDRTSIHGMPAPPNEHM
ncbi:hypothetical protein [Bacillus sp. REN16]|uniref:hypothetical protein n=1 Tax=Bacillus sp. REN16 TaxID=2887296 RepID=UPI001E2FB9EA|nr:hypothetical protein [Bacillus sp. REN16]MCC3355369.1 hypothetical protein [Bacillus sp. REN16]